DQPFAQLFTLHELVTELTILRPGHFPLQVEDAIPQQALQRGRLFRCEIHLHSGLSSNYRAVVTAVFHLRTLYACAQSLWRNPGIHHRMHSGSIARAASTVPRSDVSQPNWSRSCVTMRLAS